MKRILRLVFNNFFLKLLSLLIAILLWNNIQRTSNKEIGLKLPIDYINLPGQYIILQAPRNLTVIFTSESSMVEEYNAIMKVIVDLSSASLGANKIFISKQNIEHPPALKVKKVSPQYITVLIDQKITKKLAIKPIITGSPAKDYFLSDYWTVPKFVKVQGPKTILDKLNYIATDPINIDNLDQTVTKIVELNLPNENIEVLTSTPIKIVLSVMEKEIEKEYKVEVQGYNAKKYDVEPGEVSVILSGPVHIIQHLSEEDILCTLPAPLRKAGKKKITVSVPQRVKVIAIKPDMVNVKLKESQKK